MPRQSPPEFRQRALRMLEGSLSDHETEYAAIRHVASKLGVGPESLCKWRRQSQVDSGQRPGMTTAESAEIRRLRKENADLRRANEILKAAHDSIFSSRSGASELAGVTHTSQRCGQGFLRVPCRSR
jgi:transposase